MTEPTKLTNAGDSLTFTCVSAGILTGPDGKPLGKYPEVEFRGRDGGREVILRVPQKSADRQLGRIPLTYAECAGKVLTFSRDHNSSDASKPYWGITLSGTATPHVPPHHTSAEAEAATVAAHGVQRTESDKGHALYAKITAWVLSEIVPQYKAKGITPTQEGTAAIVATLYIKATR